MSGTKVKESFMSMDEFRLAIDSLVGYAQQNHAVVGFMGGEPLLSPHFTEMCEYALSKIPREKLGLWSTFPDTPKYKAYAPLICKTFGNILLNDHSRDDILHAPVLMASEEYFQIECPFCKGRGSLLGAGVMDEQLVPKVCPECKGKKTVTDERNLWTAINHCWVQESWSASINKKGAWFCEVAAALSDLFDGPEGWPVEPDWWKRTPDTFREQMEWACKKCGAALPIARTRNSQDPTDDVSPGNLERLKALKSKKVARGEYQVHEKPKFDPKLLQNHGYPHQSYKDAQYRQNIAFRYGIQLTINARGYWEPTMAPAGYKPPGTLTGVEPLYQIMAKKAAGVPAA